MVQPNAIIASQTESIKDAALTIIAFPTGTVWHQYAGMRSIVLFKLHQELYGLSYVIIGDGKYALNAGHLRAWIVTFDKDELLQLILAHDSLQKLFENHLIGGFRELDFYDQFQSHIQKFSSIPITKRSVKRSIYGLYFDYQNNPASILEIEAAIWEKVRKDARKRHILPFKTLNLIYEKEKKEIRGYPTQERFSKPSYRTDIPTYLRIPLFLTIFLCIVICLVLFLLQSTGDDQQNLSTYTLEAPSPTSCPTSTPFYENIPQNVTLTAPTLVATAVEVTSIATLDTSAITPTPCDPLVPSQDNPTSLATDLEFSLSTSDAPTFTSTPCNPTVHPQMPTSSLFYEASPQDLSIHAPTTAATRSDFEATPIVQFQLTANAPCPTPQN